MAANEENAVPACYALVQPGLEEVAADEIQRDLGAAVKKTQRGVVVFRPAAIDMDLLKLRCVEDVYLLAWGTDELSMKAVDLKSIQKWTEKHPDWPQLLKLHNHLQPWPKRPTFRLITQMQGERGYRRVDAGEAVAKGLATKKVFGPQWRVGEENATLEIWLTISNQTALCGVRLSDRNMRHRNYKEDHIAASLRPTVAAAMVRLAGAAPGQVMLDPMCGAGTILAEQIELSKQRRAGIIYTWGGDIDATSLYVTASNLRKVGPAELAIWDSRRLPLAAESVDRVVCNPPFGKQLSTPTEIVPLYRDMIREWNWALKPGGKAVILVSDLAPLEEAIGRVGWVPLRKVGIQVLGQRAFITVWQKS